MNVIQKIVNALCIPQHQAVIPISKYYYTALEFVAVETGNDICTPGFVHQCILTHQIQNCTFHPFFLQKTSMSACIDNLVNETLEVRKWCWISLDQGPFVPKTSAVAPS